MIDRTQKKCFIAATACHGLLILIFLFGAALMPSRSEPEIHLITMYRSDKISDEPSGGGNPNAGGAPVPPTEIKSAPVPTPEPVKPQPRPEVAPVKPEPIETPKLEPIKAPTHRDSPKPPKVAKTKPEPKEDTTPTKPKERPKLDPNDLKVVKRSNTDRAKAEQEAAEAREKAEAKRRADQFASVFKSIGKDLSKNLVDVGGTPGVGTAGEVTTNYRDIIASKYYNAWTAPADLDDATPVVLASVTINRDGSVVTAHITKPSGNSSMDRSIARVLETVTFIEPFPASFKEQQRTVTIKFNLQAKRQTG